MSRFERLCLISLMFMCVCVEFVSTDSVHAALDSVVQLGNRKLKMCRTLTPPHMHTWTHTNPVTMETNGEAAGLEEQTVSEEAEPSGLSCAQVKLIQLSYC